VNIYITTSLRSQMKEYGDTINWSKVATDAFVSVMQQEKDRIEQRQARRRLTQCAYSWMNEGT